MGCPQIDDLSLSGSVGQVLPIIYKNRAANCPITKCKGVTYDQIYHTVDAIQPVPFRTERPT